MTKQTHDDMVKAAYYWITNAGKCTFALKEFHASTSEIPDVIGFFGGSGSVLIECKASRSDFLADKNKPFRMNPSQGMGRSRFYCCPTGMIKKEELPKKWGLIYVGKTGHTRAVVNPLKYKYSREWVFTDRDIQSEMCMMYTALRYIDKGVDLQKAVSIGRYICQYDWGVPDKMPEYPEEVAERLQTTVQQMQANVDLIHRNS